MIHDSYLAIGPGGRNRMKKGMQRKCKNITAVRSLPQKMESSKKYLVIKPMIFSEMNSRPD